MKEKLNIFWFRQDLRLDDNVGFCTSLMGMHPVMPIFIFDTEIIEQLPKDDARVSFIHKTVQELDARLKSYGGRLSMYHGKPLFILKQLLLSFDIQSVITNRSYEPYGRQRDKEIANFLSEKNIGFHTFKDHVIFEKDDVVKSDGAPYAVYTPYMKKWKALFSAKKPLQAHDFRYHIDNLRSQTAAPNLSLSDIGFEESSIKVPPYEVSTKLIRQYEETRNFPSVDGTSNLGPHLRFGTVSIRKMILQAISEENEVFWQQLIWREFFIQILWHFPKTTHNAYKPKYDRIIWRNNKEEFELWKAGKTGYPMVDAGIRQLNETGQMHNRVRMVVASFLCKHLLIDWRWGEAYFAEKLLDYEIASNVGNWQWVAGSGVDAAPYFRIFNPTSQLEKFDKNGIYIRKWIPEFNSETYPEPMVEHRSARLRCLETYKAALN
ncbi:MAG: deoxyribodipyrimidine photo-lyase [Bacteroidota bacterium]